MRVILAIITVFFITMPMHAQTEKWDAMMAQAKAYTQQKEYAKAIQCNEELIVDLEANGVTGLTETLRNSNAINYLNIAVPLLKEKKYIESKEYLDKALANAKVDSKAYYMIHTYIGHWYSTQVQSLRTDGSLNDALDFSENAEHHFDLARKTDRRLNEHIAKADILNSLSRIDEAKHLYNCIIEECNGVSGGDAIRGKALSDLGDIERKQEDYQSALLHLEEAYTLCMNTNEKSWAILTASRLQILFYKGLKDEEKARLWEQRMKALE